MNSDANPIPIINLEAQHLRLKTEIMDALERVFDSRAYIQGPHVRELEEAFCKAHGANHAAGCSNGTTALSLALEAVGIGLGDEVITSSFTFIATAEAIVHRGATPVFADIDSRTYNLDPESVEAAITSRTSAIVPVHLFGTPCAMTEICEIAERHNLVVVEDCAQAHLAKYRGQPVGTFGASGSFSFYPGKNLGACGDAGLVVSNRVDVIDQVKKLLDHGRVSKYLHDIVGHNCRMDGMQAAILSVKLRYLEEWTTRRQQNAAYYDSILRPEGFQVIHASNDAQSVYHLYVVQVANRDETCEALKREQIGFGVHYPTPIHLQESFENLGSKAGDLPTTEGAAARVISLPMCGELEESEIQRVCDVFLGVARP